MQPSVRDCLGPDVVRRLKRHTRFYGRWLIPCSLSMHPNALATFLSILYAPRSKPHLVEKHVMGDFLGVFFTPEGEQLEPYAPSMTVSHVPRSARAVKVSTCRRPGYRFDATPPPSHTNRVFDLSS